MNAYRIGLLYELRAALYIRRRGYRILARRFRARGGELDLIARDGDTVVFLEVKARPNSPLGAGVEAVGADKRRRMRGAAAAYLERKHWLDCACRYDIIEFSRAGTVYLKDAF